MYFKCLIMLLRCKNVQQYLPLMSKLKINFLRRFIIIVDLNVELINQKIALFIVDALGTYQTFAY